MDEPPEDGESVLSVGYYAAGTVGALCGRLDPKAHLDAETLRMARAKFNEMLKGPHVQVGLNGLMRMPCESEELLLDLAANRSLPYATRKLVLAGSGGGPKDAKRLIPLLSDDTRSDDGEGPSIAVCAANAIARMVEKQEWDSEGPPQDFIRKAHAWAEAAESR